MTYVLRYFIEIFENQNVRFYRAIRDIRMLIRRFRVNATFPVVFRVGLYRARVVGGRYCVRYVCYHPVVRVTDKHRYVICLFFLIYIIALSVFACTRYSTAHVGWHWKKNRTLYERSAYTIFVSARVTVTLARYLWRRK